MKEKKLYIVFDQIPPKSSGGLVATYVNLVELLKNEYTIEIISIFKCDDESKKQFKNNKINIINVQNIDMRFFNFFKYLKQKKIKKFLFGLYSGFYYFIKIPSTKFKINKLIKKDDKVIVSCPSAAIFMSKKTKFILEFHTDYKYFFGNNLLGRIQTFIMTKPSLSLFRSKADSEKAKKSLNPNYIYNFFDNSNITKNENLIKNKIVFLGRLHDVKQPKKLIELAYKLKKQNKNFILDIYGQGPLKEEIEKLILKYKLQNNVFLKGFTNNKNIYKNYSLLWLTSKMEGLPMVIIEAKANAVPTISTNWGDTVFEVIDNGNDGYVTNKDNEFVELTNKILKNDKLQKKLSANAYKNFRKFSKEEAKKKWIKYLETYNK